MKRQLRNRGYKIISLDAYNKLKASASTPPIAIKNSTPWPWLRQSYRFKTLIDIGANDGEFGAFIANYFKMESSYFFEPLKECIAEIERNTAGLPNREIFCTALSDESGLADFKITNANSASSLMRLSEQGKKYFPEIYQSRAEKITVSQLDELLYDRDFNDEVFIKIDVQGFECKVIGGGRKTFERAKGVLVEMSFSEIYENQPLFHEVHMMLHECGLTFSGIKNQISSKEFEPLFAHCLYLRR